MKENKPISSIQRGKSEASVELDWVCLIEWIGWLSGVLFAAASIELKIQITA